MLALQANAAMFRHFDRHTNTEKNYTACVRLAHFLRFNIAIIVFVFKDRALYFFVLLYFCIHLHSSNIRFWKILLTARNVSFSLQCHILLKSVFVYIFEGPPTRTLSKARPNQCTMSSYEPLMIYLYVTCNIFMSIFTF